MATPTTTAAAVRDRIRTVLRTELVPLSLSDDRYLEFNNEEAADFRKMCELNVGGSWRLFQVDDDGDEGPPPVSNMDVEQCRVTFVIIVAYSHTHRAGVDNALSRRAIMKQDQKQLEHAIGMCGRENFSGAYPDACWVEGETTREEGEGVDFLVITQTMQFNLDVTP